MGSRPGETIAVGLIALLGTSVYLLAALQPSGPVLDETVYVEAAERILRGELFEEGLAFNYEHPPLAKEFQAMGLAIWQTLPLAIRAANAVAGGVGLAAVYLIGRRLFSSTRTGAFAAGLLFLDNLWFSAAKTALLDTISMAFLLGAFATALRPRHAAWPVPCLLGLAIACKLTALWGAPILFYLWLRDRAPPADRRTVARLGRFTFVTLGAFTATYLPWFVEGARMNGVASIPAFFFSGLREMIRYHSGRHGIGFHTDPVQWFAFQRLHVWHTQATPDGQIATMTDIGNPILWWTSAALLVLGLSQLANVHLRGRRAPAVVLWGADSTHFLLLSLITFSMWAPFFFLSRREYQYYMLEAIPFLALCLASFLAVWSRQRIGRWISLGLGLVLVAAFLAYLPFSLALPVPDGYAKALLPQGFFEAPWK